MSDISGSYAITISTPMGDRNSVLNLIVNDSAVSGTLVNDKGTFDVTNGTFDGKQIIFDTVVITILGQLKAHVSCVIMDNQLSGKLKIPLGELQVVGHKII
ncbi:MAG: hypothetical protein KBD37_04350 [Burkholderiales bacterium]|nr:hypothetical protein [Burkholderiales bacterium]